MAGDYTRFTFNPLRDYASVLMQQGRVQLDADFNELGEILDRRLRAETVDIIGRGVVPKETPDGFKIEVAGGVMTIGPGRIYVDGLLAENHGKQAAGEPPGFDRVLEEIRGSLPIRYSDEQPYYPNPPALPASGGPHLVYLDVWRREVTAIEEPLLVEKALGTDTAARMQTVWQVKLHPDVVPGLMCSTPDDQIPGWIDVITPSQGRLTTNTVGQPSSDDPCTIPPNGGYRGTENRLYRVEVHEGGTLGTAKFKWSRDNASIATTVTGIDSSRTMLTVVQTGRDSVLRFAAGDWVEITDDVRELHGEAGLMAKVLEAKDNTITLTAAIAAGVFPTSADGSTTPARHTRVRRWDQKGQTLDSNGVLVSDVEANGGLITTPASSAVGVVLEDGVTVNFSAATAGGRFKVGDYWVFAARTADASVEPLNQAAPLGIHHHYCRLAVVTFPDDETSCRTFWPPEFGEKGCDCTVCVTPETHNSGTLSIQMAIDQLKAKGIGGKVCLAPGQYNLREPVKIQGAASVQLTGHGLMTLLLYQGSSPAIEISNSVDVGVEKLSLITVAAETADNQPTGSAASVLMRNCFDVKLRNCYIVNLSSLFGGRDNSARVPVIGLTGALFEAQIADNVLVGGIGILSLTAGPRKTTEETGGTVLLSFGLKITDNFVIATRSGVVLTGFSFHIGETSVSGNSIFGASDRGIQIDGLVASPQMLNAPGQRTENRASLFSSHVDIFGNTLSVRGAAIEVGVDETRIDKNDISAFRPGVSGDGILLTTGLDATGISRCQVTGNRITAVGENGISIGGNISSAMIKQNVIEAALAGGIVMLDGSRAGRIAIENNQILGLLGTSKVKNPAAGIRLFNAEQADISSNQIDGVGRTATQNQAYDGIVAQLSSSIRIIGNDVANVGPDSSLGAVSGIRVMRPFRRLDVTDNSVAVDRGRTPAPTAIARHALLVASPAAFFQGGSTQPVVLTQPASGVSDFFTAFEVVAVEGRFIGFFEDFVINVAAIVEEIAGVHGNLFESDIRAFSLASCDANGVVTFSDNRCFIANVAGGNFPITEVVRLSGTGIIVNANYVRSSGNTVAIRLLSFAGPGQPAVFTALGNITGGNIIANGSALTVPWDALNVRLS